MSERKVTTQKERNFAERFFNQPAHTKATASESGKRATGISDDPKKAIERANARLDKKLDK